MKAGHRRIIGFILILFICVTGMYFGDVKVDSVFVCPSVDISGACIETVDSVADNSKACTSEMLGIRRTVTLRDNHVRTSGRREYRITVDFIRIMGTDTMSVLSMQVFLTEEIIMSVRRNLSQIIFTSRTARRESENFQS